MENLPIYLILLQTTMFNNDIWKTVKYSPSIHHKTDAYHSAELYNHSASSSLQIHSGRHWII